MSGHHLTAMLVGAMLCLTALAESARAQADDVDFGQYRRLVDEARAAHERLEQSGDIGRPTLLEVARDADLAVLDWLEAFTVTEAFAALDAVGRGLALQDRDRTELNLVLVLLELDRCWAAAERAARALDRLYDAPVRPQLNRAGERARACVDAWSKLVVECAPTGAEVLVDGVVVGHADDRVPVSPGTHAIEVRAAGYNSLVTTLELAADQDRHVCADLGQAGRPSPTWVEASLWGAGAVAIGLGVAYFIMASDRADDLAGLESRGAWIVDPAGEREVIDAMRLGAGLSLAAGLVAATLGTVLFALDNAPRESGPRVGVGPEGRGIAFGWLF